MNKVLVKLVILSMGLSGCQLFSTTEYASNDKYQYLKSQNGPDLIIPKPLSDANISDFYYLSDQKQAKKVNITPPVMQNNDHS